MDVLDFDYNLPEELIAQSPLKDRASSRLLILDKKSGELTDEHFYNIINYLSDNDVLVLNDTKVMPSRIYGEKVDTLAHIEFLLLKEIDKDTFEALAKPARRISEGTIIKFKDLMKAKVIKKGEDGLCVLKFEYEGIFIEKLEALGEMPLPPYIHEKLKDQNRYQTVYADKLGSAAAPTAGLHFTKELLKQIE